MASVKDTASFFAHGNSKQFEYCLKLYPQVLRLKAEKRNKKPEELIRLDDWYQNELPKKIKSRGKDAHMVHEELVQTMKWKQSRGKFYPQLSYLVKVNTPRAVMQETKKAFRKLPNLEQAITALSNLKGVGTTMASALLAAAAPDSAPFMADECLMAIPEIEGIDYTTKEYLNFVQHIQTTVTRLNSEKDSNSSWSPHRVELALWTHYVASDLKPELLEDLPQGTHHPISVANGVTTTTVVTSNNATNDDDSIETTNDENDDEENNVCITKQKGLSTISTPSATTITPAAKEAESSVDSITGGEDISLPPTSVALEQPETAVVLTSLDADDTTTPSDVNTSNKAPAAQQLNPLDPSDESNLEPTAPNGNNGNGAIDSLDESTRSEDSLGKPITPIVANDETNDSDSYSSTKRSLDCESYEEQTENSQPETKKLKPLE